MLTRKVVFLAGVQSAQGTPATLVAADDAVQVMNPVIGLSPEILERSFAKSNFGKSVHQIGKNFQTGSFEVELKSSGNSHIADSADDVPEFAAFLRGSGMSETITAETSGGAGDGTVVYKPVSSGFEYLTIEGFFDGVRHRVTDAVCDWEIVAEAGKVAVLKITFMGLYAAVTDVTFPTSDVTLALKPPVVKSAAFSMDGDSLTVQQLALKLNNEISERPDVNAADAIAGFDIVDRAPDGSINPEATTEAVHASFGNWMTVKEMVLAMTIGQTAGNICQIDATKCAYKEVKRGDRSGRVIYDKPFGFYGDTDNVLSLTFK
jgi:hypothetical protein